jgi:hypothetical protein
MNKNADNSWSIEPLGSNMIFVYVELLLLLTHGLVSVKLLYGLC